MKRLALLALLLVGCGHIPKADPSGVPPPWPAAPAPVKITPAESRPASSS